MTQYQMPQPMEPTYAEPPKTSGLAIASIVCSLICCIPLVTPILGILLGLIAFVTIGSNPLRTGRGLAFAGVLIGIVVLVGQIWLANWSYKNMYLPVAEGPRAALAAGFSGDIAGFKAGFHGTGATATDAEAQQFIDTLRSRYGNFVTAELNQQRGQVAQPKPGQPEGPFPYLLTFENGSVDCTVLMVFADQNTGQLIMQPGSIVVHDPDLGDVEYPPGASISGAGQPSGGTSTPEDEQPDTSAEDSEEEG